MDKIKPKVCLLKSTLTNQGGLEKYSWRIARGFAERDIPVTFLTSEHLSEHRLLHNIDYQNFSIKSKSNSKRLEEFDRHCLQFTENTSYDIVFGLDRNRFQTHIRAGNGVHRAFLERRKKFDPFFRRLSTRLNPLNRHLLSIEKTSFEHPKLKILFTNSNMVREEALKYYNTDPSKVKVVHNGVEWHEMKRDFSSWVEQKNRFAATHGLDPSIYQFLFLGSGYYRKGLRPLLESLARMKNRDFHLSVVGKEKKMAEYIHLANKLGLQKRVTFFGPRKDVRSFYQFADSLVIPSFYDPFANVTVEALAMGLFVVSSKSNGGHEVLTEENGLIIPDLLDRESFTETLSKAMDYPKTWIRSQAIRNSVEHLDFSNQLTKLLDLTLASVK